LYLELEVRKWGNSYGLRLNKTLAELLKVTEGDKLRVEVKEDRFEITRAPQEESEN